MNFSHVFISRPRQSADELAGIIAPLGLRAIVQPAFSYSAIDARAEQEDVYTSLESATADTLIVFTSPRAVAHGLAQLPESLRFQARFAAIGPATAKALSEAGARVSIRPARGYTSEALLETLKDHSPDQSSRREAYILAAPGGRLKLFENLAELGWKTRFLMVYKAEPCGLDKSALSELGEASGVLSVWTSANAMKALSARLPPAIWFQLCQGDWLVISERLKRLARAYGPPRIHLAAGPGNQELMSAIRGLV